MKNKFLVIFFVWFSLIASSQIIQVNPMYPNSNSTITIIYDASKGNAELEGYPGDVYMHTGLITNESQNPGDWKYVVSDWGVEDPKVLMSRIGENLYQISFNIAEYYGINPSEVSVLKLAFVFRNGDGSISGRDVDNNDIFYPVNLNSSGDYLSHITNEKGLYISTTEGNLSIKPYTTSIVRLEFVPNNSLPSDTSYSIIMEAQSPEFTVENNISQLLFTCDNLVLKIDKSPIKTHFYEGENLITSEEMGFYSQENRQGVRLMLSESEQLQGGGSRGIQINRNGYQLQNYNQAHYGYGANEKNLNISIPFINSSKGYGLFFDNHSAGIMDLGVSSSNTLDFSGESGNMVYYFIKANSYEGLIENYTLLTGRQDLPPLWSLGYIQSRFGYESESHARQTVSDMQNDNFPLDALVLDLYWFGDPGRMGDLDWDYSKWPSPVQMMSDFKSTGVKTILITEPYFTQVSDYYNFISAKGWFGKTNSGSTYLLDNFWAGKASLMDFTNEETLDWMWSFYKGRKEEGASGWWSDLGEPENHPNDMIHQEGSARDIHNIYSLLWAQSIYDNYANEYPEERLFNLIRSGYAGMQRYSTFPWSGDIQKSWEGLQVQIPIMLGMGMSGVAYIGSDIGGFTGELNEELYTRWMQQGVFSPIMRAHGVNSITEPVYFSEPYKSIVRESINLRYKLLPYNYSLAWRNSITARPLALPMDYFEMTNTFLQNINNQYFWGEEMLVAPIMEEGSSGRSVIFPEGNWIDFKTNKTYTGQNIYSITAPLNTIPVFVKGGSFIPLTKSLSTTDNYNTDTLLIWYYPDNYNPNSNYTLFIDDGHSASSLETQNFELIKFDGSVNYNNITINLHKEGIGFSGSPVNREMMFEIKRLNNHPLSVTLDDVEMSIADNIEDYYANYRTAYFDADSHILMLHFLWDGLNSKIEIEGSGVGIGEINPELSKTFVLHKPVPNPFSEEVSLAIDVDNSNTYLLRVYDIYGKVIFSNNIYLDKLRRSQIKWNGKSSNGNNVQNGSYIIHVQNKNGKSQYQKVILMRN